MTQGLILCLLFPSLWALYPYPSGHLLIYCLTPGTKLGTDSYTGRLLIVHTAPSVYQTIAKFKELQPPLEKLECSPLK